MHISLEVSDAVVREAELQGLPLPAFLEMLIEKGMEEIRNRPTLTSALDRIRALRGSGK